MQIRWFLLAGLLVVSTVASALRLTPLDSLAPYSSDTHSLSLDQLAELSLIVSGVADSQRPGYQQQLERWRDQFLASRQATAPEVERGEAVLAFLHTGLFKAYSTYQTRVDVVLDRGSFNCVSSAVLYMYLGRSAGLKVEAVATPDHAFCQVILTDGRAIDVETTNKYGFDPGVKREFHDSFGATGFQYVPPGHYSQRKAIGDRQLLGLLLQNRMADFQRQGQAEEDVGLGIDRWVIEQTPEAQRTLIDGFVNYAAILNQTRQYLQGLALVEKMLPWTGQVPEAQNLVNAFLNNQINLLLDQEDYGGALSLATQWKNRGFLDAEQWNQTTAIILASQLTQDVRILPFDQAAAKVEQAFSLGSIDAGRRQELLAFVYGQEVQTRAKKQGSWAAWQFIDTLPEALRSLPALVQARNVYTYNWSVEIHNRFAQLWNSGQKDAAKKLLSDSLALLPSSTMLKKDLVMLQGK